MRVLDSLCEVVLTNGIALESRNPHLADFAEVIMSCTCFDFIAGTENKHFSTGDDMRMGMQLS